MQDAFLFDEAPAVAPSRSIRPSTAVLTRDLSAQQLAWGRDVLGRYAAGNGRSKWHSGLSEDDALRLAAATYRICRIKREGMALSQAGRPRDSLGWIDADPELAMANYVLCVAFVADGDLPLMPEGV